MAIPIASPAEVDAIADVAASLAAGLRDVAATVEPGATPMLLSSRIGEALDHAGLESAILGYRGPTGKDRPFSMPAVVWCNDERSDREPSRRLLVAGDLVTIDVAARRKSAIITDPAKQGWIADASLAMVVGASDASAGFHPSGSDTDVFARGTRLIAAATNVTNAIIAELKPGGSWSLAAAAARGAANAEGVHIAPGLAGHGIGRVLHQPPAMSYRAAERELRLWPGMVFTIEPVIVEPPKPGQRPWSCSIEHTVAMSNDGPRVLTRPAALKF